MFPTAKTNSEKLDIRYKFLLEIIDLDEKIKPCRPPTFIHVQSRLCYEEMAQYNQKNYHLSHYSLLYKEELHKTPPTSNEELLAANSALSY